MKFETGVDEVTRLWWEISASGAEYRKRIAHGVIRGSRAPTDPQTQRGDRRGRPLKEEKPQRKMRRAAMGRQK